MSRKMVFGRYDYTSFCCFAGYAACSAVVPAVLVKLAQSLNFPLQDGGMGTGGALQLGRSTPMVAAMVFCGFAAGRRGKIKTLGVAMICMSIVIPLAAWSPTYILLSCAGVPGCGFFSWLMEVVGDQVGVRLSFLLVPICYSLLGCLIGCDWLPARREAAARELREVIQ